MTQTVQSQKRRRGPKPTGKGICLGVRLQPNQIAALDKLIEAQDDPTATRGGMAAAIVATVLVEDGYLQEEP